MRAGRDLRLPATACADGGKQNRHICSLVLRREDIVLASVAAGRQTPSLDEQHAVHAARHASDPRYHPPMGKRSSAKKPARKIKAPS